MVIKFMLPIRMFIMDPDQVGINSDSFRVFEYLPNDHLKKSHPDWFGRFQRSIKNEDDNNGC